MITELELTYDPFIPGVQQTCGLAVTSTLGVVDSVEIYINTVLHETITSGFTSVDLQFSAGSYQVDVVAYDADDSESQTYMIDVVAPEPPTRTVCSTTLYGFSFGIGPKLSNSF